MEKYERVLKHLSKKSFEKFGLPPTVSEIYLNCVHGNLPYPFAKALLASIDVPEEDVKRILSERKTAHYLFDEDIAEIPLKENEFVIRDNSFSKSGIPVGSVVCYDPQSISSVGLMALEFAGIIFAAYVSPKEDGIVKLIFLSDFFADLMIPSDLLVVKGNLSAYRLPGEEETLAIKPFLI